MEDYQGGKLYLMENVPAYVCQECGEVWVPEPIMFEFEKMISTAKEHHHKKRPSTKLTKAKTKKKTSKN
ncbi:MAG: YgiT-type zinc finger protein, partial [Candidatus Margulisbacteria bacterium]|nr:YgiT-type zinc finger protein [Candidatus Margulisiibacteriota bacterium]